MSLPATRGSSRWTGSAWLFVREEGGSALAPGGTLGGSQSGVRVGYRLNASAAAPLALGGRFYSPLDDADAAEVALGVEWQPVPDVPARLLAERRQAIGRSGRSAFSLLAYGGVSDLAVAEAASLDAYGQAGIVGAKSRDLFADGSVRLSAPVDDRRRLRLGAGVWAAVQPGAGRLDIGPSLIVRLMPQVSVQADWRFRVAGDAEPDSGPSLTLSTGF